MPRHATPLSVRRVQSLKTRGYYCDGDGLYLQVSKTGSKSWIFRYRLAGKNHDMGLGKLATFSLAEARERAKKARQLVADGIDPVANRQAKRTAAVPSMTFKQCAEAYIA